MSDSDTGGGGGWKVAWDATYIGPPSGGSMAGGTSPGQPEPTGGHHEKVVAELKEMAKPTEAPPGISTAEHTMLKFGSTNPELTAKCNACGQIYGKHFGHKCPPESHGTPGALKVSALDPQPEWPDQQEIEVDDEACSSKGECMVAASSVHPQIEVREKGGVRLLRKYRTDHYPLVKKEIVAPDYPLMAGIATWYVLEVIKNVYLPKADASRKMTRSFERFTEQVEEEHNELTTELVTVFYDYIALATWGEARHAWAYASLVSPFISYRPTRFLAAREAVNFNPVEFLPILEKLFKVGVWSSGSFGGRKWGMAAEYGQTRGKVKDAVFVDHCVDLVHNSGPLFSKPYVIQPVSADTWKSMLDYKSRSKYGLIGPKHPRSFPMFETAETMLTRAKAMQLIQEDWVLATAPGYRCKHKPYKAIKWGNTAIEPLLVATPRAARCRICQGVAGLCPCKRCSICTATGCMKHRFCDVCHKTKFVKGHPCCNPYTHTACSECEKDMVVDCKCTYVFGANYEPKKQKEQKGEQEVVETACSKAKG